MNSPYMAGQMYQKILALRGEEVAAPENYGTTLHKYVEGTEAPNFYYQSNVYYFLIDEDNAVSAPEVYHLLSDSNEIPNPDIYLLHMDGKWYDVARILLNSYMVGLWLTIMSSWIIIVPIMYWSEIYVRLQTGAFDARHMLAANAGAAAGGGLLSAYADFVSGGGKNGLFGRSPDVWRAFSGVDLAAGASGGGLVGI